MEKIKLVLVRYFGINNNEEFCGPSIYTIETLKDKKILSDEEFSELIEKNFCSVEIEEKGLTPAQNIVYETINIIKDIEGKVFIDLDRLKVFGYCFYFPEINDLLK